MTTSVQRYTVNMTAWTMSRETLFELEFGEFPMINMARNGVSFLLQSCVFTLFMKVDYYKLRSIVFVFSIMEIIKRK